MTETVRRSWLLIPAMRADLVEKAGASRADVVVLDLEDLVHDRRKPEARAGLRNAMAQAGHGGAEIFVRCDIELLYADLEAAVWYGIHGIVLPKVETVEQVREADRLLAAFEAERGIRKAPLAGTVEEPDNPRTIEDGLELHLALETGRGNHDVAALIAASPRVRSVSLGRADLVMDLRPEPSGELHLLPYLMQRLVIAARAAGVTPIGAWWQGNSRGLRASPADTLVAAELGRAAGFKGGFCVELDQVDALNAGFTPGAEEVATARAALTGDRETTVASAQALLAWATACEARDASREAILAAARGIG